MAKPTPVSRRGFVASASALALLPGLARAQSAPPSFAAFSARCRDLAGFDVLPRDLIGGLHKRLPGRDLAGLMSNGDADVQKRVLKALYTGVYNVDGDTPERMGYPSALMYAAIEDAVNVPSFCGGVPAYWSAKPDVA
ncbi:MAG: sugar dehydrogenase complex small subunit [Pseudomonadota bacterium]